MEINFFLNFFNISLGIDNSSSFFICLVTFIMPFCFFYNYNNIFIMYREYAFFLLIIEFALIFFFLVTDLLWFYIFFEMLLFPFFLIIISFGYRKRKNHAAYMFLFFTIFGSIFLLFGILLLYFIIGTTDFRILSLLSLNWIYQIFFLVLFFYWIIYKSSYYSCSYLVT
jgi:NADH-ubiquinone oxidoreductase chain 4